MGAAVGLAVRLAVRLVLLLVRLTIWIIAGIISLVVMAVGRIVEGIIWLARRGRTGPEAAEPYQSPRFRS